MKNLKTYKMFDSSVELTPEQVEWLNRCTRGTTWHLTPRTGLVDVDGNFGCSGGGLSDFKGVRFGVVGGIFHCNNNQLTTLEGSPHRVGNSFLCYDNQLTTLEGAPQEIGGGFSCSNNQITSLNGSPQKVIGNFACEDNQLTILEGAPLEVGGGFYCANNQLTTLDGSPQEVGEDFDCRNNQLTTLEGSPHRVGGVFYGDANPIGIRTLENIFRLMKSGESYLKTVESLWSGIPAEDQALLYRPEFEWVVGDERKKLDALRAYQGFKGMI